MNNVGLRQPQYAVQRWALHTAQHCPLLELVTPQRLDALREASALAREGGQAELAQCLQRWADEFAEALLALKAGDCCGSELWLG